MPKNKNNTRKNKNPMTRSTKSKKKNKTKTVMTSPGVGISHCAMKYALAIADPWNDAAKGACIPRHPSRPSYKVTGFQRQTVTIGTSNYGFVLFSPCIANDYQNLYYSTSTFAGTTFASVTSSTTGVSRSVMTNLPFGQTSFVSTGASVSASVAGRIVSSSLSWQYTGTVSNMGGLAYALVHPDHNNLNDEAVSIPNYSECQVIRVDNRRHFIGASSLDDSECSYSEGHTSTGSARTIVNVIYPYSNGECHNSTDTAIGGAPIAVWFTGTAGNTFEVEVIQHCEFVGKSTQAQLTPTHSDSVGFEIVQNAAARLPQMIQAAPQGVERKSLMSKALQAVGKELSPVLRLGAQQLVTSGVRALVGGTVGFLASGGNPAGAYYGGALGASSGQLMLTNG